MAMEEQSHSLGAQQPQRSPEKSGRREVIRPGLYERADRIDIENINDKKFQSLLKKELDFCKKHKKKILKKVENFYTTQVKNNTVKFASCNFALLEKAMEDYKKEKE